MKKLAFFLMIIYSLNISVASAANEWIDKKYDFKKVKKVIIIAPIIENVDEISKRNMIDEFKKRAENKKVKVLDLEQIVDLLPFEGTYELAQFIDNNEIENMNRKDAEAALKEFGHICSRYLVNSAELVILVSVNNYNTGYTYVEGYSYTTTEYEKVKVKSDKHGDTTIEYPVTKEHNVPGGYRTTLSAAVEFISFETKKGDIVWMKNDDRGKTADMWGSQEPMSMYKRIIKSFFSDLESKIDA